jgi:dihydroorotate dehydrogenase
MKEINFYHYIRNLLFKLDPESSHNITLGSLRVLNQLHILKTRNYSLPQTIMGIEFVNPVGLAAGLDKNGEYIDALAALGFGFIEIGTVTPRAQPGNPKPRLFRLPEAEALINRLGFNNKGVDYLVEQVKHAKFSGVLGINIGKNFNTPLEKAADDYLFCLKKVYPYASYITINISSPNTTGLRDLQFGDYLNNLLRDLKQEQAKLTKEFSKYVPLVVKISPDLDNRQVAELGQSLLRTEIDGVIATNTTIARVGVEGLKNADEQGGLSGKPLLAASTDVVHQLARVLQGKIPIIAAGGIMSDVDALAKKQAGASLVQLYTGFIYHGQALIKGVVSAWEE